LTWTFLGLTQDSPGQIFPRTDWVSCQANSL
jgi:hypothetical protein